MVGHLRSNKPETLSQESSFVCCMASSPDRSKFVVGCLDGTFSLINSLGGSLKKVNIT